MKKYLAVVAAAALVSLLSVTASAQREYNPVPPSTVPPAKKPSGERPLASNKLIRDKVKKELDDFELRFYRAAFANDRETFKRMMAAEFVSVNTATKAKTNKTQTLAFLSILKGLPPREVSLEESELLSYEGNSATLSGILTFTSEEQGKRNKGRNQFIDKFVRRAGYWQIVSTQYTPLTDNPK